MDLAHIHYEACNTALSSNLNPSAQTDPSKCVIETESVRVVSSISQTENAQAVNESNIATAGGHCVSAEASHSGNNNSYPHVLQFVNGMRISNRLNYQSINQSIRR